MGAFQGFGHADLMEVGEGFAVFVVPAGELQDRFVRKPLAFSALFLCRLSAWMFS